MVMKYIASVTDTWTGLALLLLAACGQQKSSPDQQAAPDEDPLMSMIYVGEMHYFQETNEFYTSLYLLSDYDQEQQRIIGLFDSVVYESDIYARRTMTMKKARAMFFLDGLDSLLVYDTNHRFVSNGLLQRVECLVEGNKKSFIAVYKGEYLKSDIAEEYYCMNRFLKNNFVEHFSSRVIIDPSLDNYIIHRLSVPKKPAPKIMNIVVTPGEATISVITTPEASYLTEVKDNQFALLKNVNARYRIGKILPLPFHVNDKPLLLASLYIPGSPDTSVSLGVFADFQEYRFLKYNRLSLKKKTHERKIQFMSNSK